MSKYNKLPALIEPEQPKEETQTPISKLCCLPILMEGRGQYKNGLKNFLLVEELLPHSERLQIYQMLYMEKMLDELREYDLPNDEAKQQDPIDVLSKMNSSGNTAQKMQTVVNLMKYKQSGDVSLLTPLITSQNPMLAMLLPMLSQKSGKSDPNSSDMLSAMLPMLTGTNTDMLSSLFNM